MIGAKELEHLEKLSRIRILHEHADAYMKKLNSVLTYIGHLAEVQTKGITPTSQVTNLENRLREDEVGESLSQEEALQNSKHTYKGYFKLPKVIE